MWCQARQRRYGNAAAAPIGTRDPTGLPVELNCLNNIPFVNTLGVNPNPHPHLIHAEIFLAQQFLSKHEPIQGILAPSLHL